MGNDYSDRDRLDMSRRTSNRWKEKYKQLREKMLENWFGSKGDRGLFCLHCGNPVVFGYFTGYESDHESDCLILELKMERENEKT